MHGAPWIGLLEWNRDRPADEWTFVPSRAWRQRNPVFGIPGAVTEAKPRWVNGERP